MLANSPTKNILTRIFKEKTFFRPDMVKEKELFRGDRCLVLRDPLMVQAFASDLVLFGPQNTGNLLMASAMYFDGIQGKVWVSDKVSPIDLQRTKCRGARSIGKTRSVYSVAVMKRGNRISMLITTNYY